MLVECLGMGMSSGTSEGEDILFGSSRHEMVYSLY